MNQRTKDTLIGLGLGAGVLLALNHIRWAVFPISGGPIGINRILGGPPDSPAVRAEVNRVL